MWSDESLSNDFEAPLIESQSGTELVNNDEGWVIGVRGEKLLRFPTDKHMVTIASTGGGKGTSVAIPNLLTHEGSIFSIEIGGATYRETWRFRKHVLEQEIHVIDPFQCTSEKSASINLLETLNPDAPDFYTDAVNFAESMLKSAGGKTPRDPFWEEAPLKLLSALLIHVRTSPDVPDSDRHLVNVVKLMSKHGSAGWRELMEDFAQDSGPYHSVLNEAGNLFSGAINETRDGIAMSVANAFKSFHDARIAEISSSTSFQLSDLRNKKCSLYVIMPETKHYQVHATWLRLLVERAFAACPNFGDAGKRFGHNDRVLFMLDEFTQLGKLDAVDIGMQTARQKGITIWAIFQDLGRLQSVYGEKTAASVLGSAGVTQVFDIGDPVTSKYVSERIGRKLIYIPGIQFGWSGGESNQEQWSLASSETKAEGVSQSSSVGETENWNLTVAEGTSESTTHTTSLGTSDNSAIDTSPKNILGLPSLDYKKSPSMTNFMRAEKRNFSRTSNSGVSDSTQTGTSHTESESKGGGRTSSQTTGTNRTTSKGETDTKGGSKGENSGWQYNLTLTPQIIPGLDPAEVENALGSNNNQILFIRAKTRVMCLLERRSFFHEVPRLYRCARGDFSILPPPNPYTQLNRVAFVKPRPITTSLPSIPAGEVYSAKTYTVQPALTSTQKASLDPEDSSSPAEYSDALRHFQQAVSMKARGPALSLVEDNLYSVFTRSGAAIDEEASRHRAEMETVKRGILSEQSKNASHFKVLETHRREAETKHERLVEKIKRSLITGKELDDYRKKLLTGHSRAGAFFSDGKEYRRYLAVLNRIARSWKGINAPPRPAAVPDVEEPNLELLSVPDLLAKPIELPTFDIPPIPTPNFEIASLRLFDFSMHGVTSPGITERLKVLSVELENGESIPIRELQEMIHEKSQREPSLWDRTGFNARSLSNLRYKRNSVMPKLLKQLRDYQHAADAVQKSFHEWTQASNALNKTNHDRLAGFSSQLRTCLDQLKDSERKLDAYIESLQKTALAFARIEDGLRDFFLQTHNMIATSAEWEKLQANEVRFLGAENEETNSEPQKSSSRTKYEEIDPYLDTK